MSKFHFVIIINAEELEKVTSERTVKEVSLKWSHCRNLSSDLKVAPYLSRIHHSLWKPVRTLNVC